MQIPHRESYRNVLLVNYLKGCAASEALPIKPIRDEGMFAHCQGRGTIKKTLSLCLPENRPSPPNLSHVQGVADGWACISQAWKSPPFTPQPLPKQKPIPPLIPATLPQPPPSAQLGQVIQVYIYLFPLILFFISFIVSRPVRLINI